MKALILAGGQGKRLQEVIEGHNKCMVDIHGQPVISYSLECCTRINSDCIFVIVGYRAEQIAKVYGSYYKHKRITYIYQPHPKGMVDAIECAKDAIGTDDFALFLGDEVLINPKHENMIYAFYQTSLFGFCGVALTEDISSIRKTYTIHIDDSGAISELVEKPKHPFNNYIGTGNCVFKNAFFKYIDKTPKNIEKDEKLFTDVIQCAISYGEIVKPFIICDTYYNINARDDFEAAQGFPISSDR